MICCISPRIPLGIWLCFCIVIAPFIASAAETQPGLETLSLSDLQRLVSEHGRVIQSCRLAGVVCAVAPNRRLVALQDDSATVLLELPSVDPELHVGDRLTIEGGKCSLVGSDVSIQINNAAVVDNDGHHPSRMRSGKVFLQAGLQPVRLAWFNGVADAVLKLEWEGPGLKRQPVPATVLWRKPLGFASPDEMQPGLDYTACNGDGYFLAGFENQKPIVQGVATNFDVAYRVRPEHTALSFDGYIKTPGAGTYTFYLTSDDGARLQVGDSSVSCTRISSDRKPYLATRTLKQAWSAPGNSSWVEVRGRVASASVDQEHLRIDLLVDGNLIPVTVVGGATLLATNLLPKSYPSKRNLRIFTGGEENGPHPGSKSGSD